MRQRFVFRGGRWVEDTGLAESAPSVHVLTDRMEATRHPVDGKLYDSKSAFRRLTKAAGLEEMGNERPQDRPRIDERRDQERRLNAIRTALGDYGLSR